MFTFLLNSQLFCNCHLFVYIFDSFLFTFIVEAYHASKTRDHVRILSRHKIIEDRKEYLEKLNIHREAEEQRKAAQALMEQQAAEEERLKAERDKRERERAQEQLREIQKEKIEEKIKQIAQTPIGDKVLKKMTEKELAELDAVRFSIFWAFCLLFSNFQLFVYFVIDF